MIVALDIETTGLSKKDCGITQLSMIKVDETKNFNRSEIDNPNFSEVLTSRPDSITVWIKYNASDSKQKSSISAFIHD